MKQEIPKDSRAIIEKIIRRHPYVFEQYFSSREAILESTPSLSGMPRSGGSVGESRLEKSVVKLNSKKMQRMEKEINAVKTVYEMLPEKYKKIIRYRFWQERDTVMTYALIAKLTGFHESQCKRIVGIFIEKVGIELGEL